MKPFLTTLVALAGFFPLTLQAQEKFKSWNETDTVTAPARSASTSTTQPGICSRGDENSLVPTAHLSDENRIWLGAALLATVVAGIFVRYQTLRRWRPLFLVASVALLGFYRGSCPCPVGGFQEAALAVFGSPSHGEWIWWFAILLPLTYVFGRVWCGWICQLGALQELIHANSNWELLSSARIQTPLRYLRLLLFGALIVQLLMTHTNWWKTIDPFRTAFNLFASQWLGWVLLAALLTSSVFAYRPFCRVFCPVGLVLAWISRIPAATVLQASAGCLGCKRCSTTCKSGAISYENKIVSFEKEACIACGECATACPLRSLDYKKSQPPFAGRVVFNAPEKGTQERS